MDEYYVEQEPQESRSWIGRLTTNQQLGYGCLAIVLIVTSVVYCAGTFSWVVRPALTQRVPTPTILVRPTLGAPPTLPPPTFINLPPGVLLATPTQAPIPTREPFTLTPTVDLTNPAPVITGTVTITATRSSTPTRKPSTPLARP